MTYRIGDRIICTAQAKTGVVISEEYVSTITGSTLVDVEYGGTIVLAAATTALKPQPLAQQACDLFRRMEPMDLAHTLDYLAGAAAYFFARDGYDVTHHPLPVDGASAIDTHMSQLRERIVTLQATVQEQIDALREPPHGPCLHCGFNGHASKNCPNR